ncbi:unnamed protein product [Zymoseptoria tritici ST99CH_1A5]|uniref:BHLH domain-containing protein n=1 Tax=Zymoseptoria tritici ST99CH_1A5 TaxID=1276529 RepID=A0A1Y6LJ44_ZYMTR|nr:unnamed protein product [Zymoseptoria tritici ST99CH_1A5]
MATVWTTPIYNADLILNQGAIPSGPLHMIDSSWQHNFRREDIQHAPQDAYTRTSHHYHLPSPDTYAEHMRYNERHAQSDHGRPSMPTWAGPPRYHAHTADHSPISPFNSLEISKEESTSSISDCVAPSTAEYWNRGTGLTHPHHPSSPGLSRPSAGPRRCSDPTPNILSPPSQGYFPHFPHYPNNGGVAVDPQTNPSGPRSARSLPISFPDHSARTSPGPRRTSAHHTVLNRVQQAATLGRRSSMQSLSTEQSSGRARRVPHNLVERRYRDNLNHQIESLRLALPTLRDARPSAPVSANGSSSNTEQDDGAAAGPRMPSKAVIISTAANYIKDLETEREHLLSATKALQDQVYSLQKVVSREDCSMIGYFNRIPEGSGGSLSAVSSA